MSHGSIRSSYAAVTKLSQLLPIMSLVLKGGTKGLQDFQLLPLPCVMPSTE